MAFSVFTMGSIVNRLIFWSKCYHFIAKYSPCLQAVITARSSAWVNSGAAAVKASLTAHRHVCADSEVTNQSP